MDINNWSEQEKRHGEKLPEGTLTILTSGDANLPRATYEWMGEPDYIRYFFKGSRVAIVPADEDEPNVYRAGNSDGIAFRWAHGRIDAEIEPGYYQLTEDDGVYIVDFSEEPDDRV